MAKSITMTKNELFPVFLKLNKLHILIVGGGNVGLEKLRSVLLNSPQAIVTLVGICISEKIKQFAKGYVTCRLLEKGFEEEDLNGKDLVILATDDPSLHIYVKQLTLRKKILTNVADTPELCDFYLSAIVQKGNIKIAISTNGKSPTMARRLKEILHKAIPPETDGIAEKLYLYRCRLNGDFSSKVKKLDAITSVLVENENLERKKWKRIASYILLAFALMLFGHMVLSYLPFYSINKVAADFYHSLEPNFWLLIMAGFLAQMVDGATSMGYGVTSAIVLMSANINPAAISGSIHAAEMFTSGASGYTHYKFGNVNMKLFRTLLIPGIVGSVMGAILLVKLGNTHVAYVRPVMAAYTFFLGVKIFINAFKKITVRQKFKSYGWLAGIGGFLDSFGGGGWGPLVSATLITKGRTPKYVVGSVSLTEFFVTVASAFTFFTLIGIQHWQVILGMVLGGLLATPIAVRLNGKLPAKASFILLGTTIIVWSIVILVKAIL